MIPLSPEMLLSMARMVPESKIAEGRQAIINTIVEKEAQTGSRLMLLMKLNEDNNCLVLSIYTVDGDYLASWPVYDLASLTAFFDGLKNFDFNQKTTTLSHETPTPEPTAAGISPADGCSGTAAGNYRLTAGAKPDESVNGNGEHSGTDTIDIQ